MSLQVQITLRTRKLGVLIRDARMAARKTVTEMAKAVSISTALLRAYEEGRKSPSLPELELLAYYLDLPVQHFWGSEALSENSPRTEKIDLVQLSTLRHRIIGTMLRQKRLQTRWVSVTFRSQSWRPSSRLLAGISILFLIKMAR